MDQPTGRPLTRDLPSLVNIAASLAPFTCQVYAQPVAQLRNFAVTKFPGSSWCPTSILLLCTFVAHLLSRGLASASVTSRMSAVAFFHKLSQLHDPTGDFFVWHLLLGAYKQFDIRPPLTLQALCILQSCDPVCLLCLFTAGYLPTHVSCFPFHHLSLGITYLYPKC